MSLIQSESQSRILAKAVPGAADEGRCEPGRGPANTRDPYSGCARNAETTMSVDKADASNRN
jgi:hypothetical protein